MESILNSIKVDLGYEPEDTGFDEPIMDEINAVFMSLTQMGVGPSDGFLVEDETAVWDDFIPSDQKKKFGAVKSYTHKKVKLAFDSASMSSALISAYERQIAEIEWRLTHAAESE